MVKWSYLDDPRSFKGKSLDSDSFFKILQKAWDLQNFTPLPSDFDSVNLFFRALGFQQFLYQDPFEVAALGRQLLLFKDHPDGHFYQRRFKEITGLTIEHFFELAFMVLVTLENNGSGIVELEQIVGSGNTVSRTDLERFLEAVSVPEEKLSARLAAATVNTAKSGDWREYFEPTPFVEFPLVRVGNPNPLRRYMYVCLHGNIFYRSLETVIFDIIRRSGAEEFMRYFGDDHENYMKRVIDYFGFKSLGDTALKERLKEMGDPKRKVADFVIEENDSEILIESKAIEMKYFGKVTQDAQTPRKMVNSSVIDGIRQAISTRKVARTFFPSEGKEPFILIVTYKDLLLVNGKTFYETVAKEEMDQMAEEFGDDFVPPENIFFLTIGEFEKLLCGVTDSQMGIGQFLRSVRLADSPEDRSQNKFAFRMHLGSAGFNKSPDFLIERQQSFLNSLEAYFKKVDA